MSPRDLDSVMSSVRSVVLLASIGLVGCASSTSDRDLQPVTAQEARTLAVGTPGGAFTAATKGVWVDPRRPSTYAEGHVPGAMSLPFGSGDFEYQAKTRLEGFDPIIVYGDDYQDILANAASKRLIEIGFKNVYTLRGGMEQWIADGYDVDRGDKPGDGPGDGGKGGSDG